MRTTQIEATKLSHARSRILADISGISPRTCRSYLKYRSKQYTTKLTTDDWHALATKDRRRPIVKQITRELQTWSMAKPTTQPTTTNGKQDSQQDILPNTNVEFLIATKNLAKTYGGYNILRQAINILEQIDNTN